ncbi:MAG: NADPH-dependent 7-cyano-7-deazaguanine reductase QueF [Parachlamydiaceae bacterium]|nr:NADPH-dependent 7-cyano-7-deazaguanine reductase QueF [Parachlamydiaceae bacterium]
MLTEWSLGKKTEYVQTYSPNLLFPVPRTLGRDKINLGTSLPFTGVDIWNGFELSWLNSKGKPEIAIAEFQFPYSTTNIIESKSFKLYLNSFNQSKFNSFDEVRESLTRDLSNTAQGPVSVKIISFSEFNKQKISDFSGTNLDNLDIQIDTYQLDTNFLTSQGVQVEETLFSHLLKSNCMATGQPDWGSVLIRYKGPKIDHSGLLKYIISYRNHVGFAEHCTERMYCDIQQKCNPKCLTIDIRYTRRGGLDINPFRSNFETPTFTGRQARQ